MSMLTPRDVERAAIRLEGICHRTPVVTSRTLNNQCDAEIYFKCENLQRMGAFKFRGAYNAISRLSEQEKRAGVITHSSGNHAQGVALAAKLLGVRAVIVMPHDAPVIKRQATEGYGAEIIPCEAAEREQVTKQIIEQSGYTLIHPYDNNDVIAGQGTAAWELFEEIGPLEMLFVPVGGGGLISGSALAAAEKSPGCRVIGVEPAIAADAKQSFESGSIVTLDHVPQTIADGLRTRHIGRRNLAIMRRHVADIVTVTEEQIEEALYFIWSRMKIVVEPSAAAALAPLLSGAIRVEKVKVGVLLSGGNVELSHVLFPERERIPSPTVHGSMVDPSVEAAERPRILLCTPLDQKSTSILEEVAVVEERAVTDEEIQDLIGDYHAVVIGPENTISGQVVEYGFNLRVIGSTSSRLDNIDVSAARAFDVNICFIPGVNTIAAAEHTLNLMLTLSQDLAGQEGAPFFQGLSGKTLGIIGFGQVGRQVASRALAFDMRVLVNQPRLTPELALTDGLESVDLRRLLREADFVSLHLPLRAETEIVIGASELALMQPSSFLINITHTELVDDLALLDAMNKGQLAGAALATFESRIDEKTPSPHPELLIHPRVVVARHVSSFTEQGRESTFEALAWQIREKLLAKRPHEALSLDILPIETLVPHENVNTLRVERLMDRLRKDAVLVNPPIVTAWQDRFIILDGATRFTALKSLGYPYVVAQIVPHSGRHFALHTWYHVISGEGSSEELFRSLKAIESVDFTEVSSGDVADLFNRENLLCYFLLRSGEYIAAFSSNQDSLVAETNRIIETYSAWGNIERTLVSDLSRLTAEYPKMVALAIFPQFKPETVFSVAYSGSFMPAGLTRFVIPGRILRLNADLRRLRKPEPIAIKRAWLSELLRDKIARSRLRFYQEPVILLDE